jgi:hypothetical protein
VTYTDTLDYSGAISVQLDTAVFPAHATTDISSTVVSLDIYLAIDSDCGTATVVCTEKPSVADDRVRIYIYDFSTLIFNGEIVGSSYGSNGLYTIKCQDVMARLKKRWGGDDRTYGAGNLPDPSTDTNTVQNIVEASSVDVSLTDIEGADFPIGVTEDIVIKGGTPDPLRPDKPAQGDVMLDLVRELDQGVVPNYCTFTTEAGVVTRRPRTIGTSIRTFTVDSYSNAWSHDHDVDTIQNKVTVIAKTIASIPTQAYAQAANSYLVAPFEYNPVTINVPRVIETEIDAQALADWVLAERNGRLHKVSFMRQLETTQYLAKTVTVNYATFGLVSQDMLVVSVHYHVDEKTATKVLTCEYRD